MDAQTLIVAVIVAACGLYLLRRILRLLRGKSAGCGACTGCASKPANPTAAPRRR